MAKDPIIDEIRNNRKQLAKRFDYDLRAIVADAHKRQRGRGKKIVSFARAGKKKRVT